MKNARLVYGNRVPESLSNLYWRGDCTDFDILDVVEDATTADELIDGLNGLKLFYKFKLDRETDSYVRLVSEDDLGNRHYLKAWKEA